jgi:hypothetical protein
MSYIESLPSTQQALAALNEAKSKKVHRWEEYYE